MCGNAAWTPDIAVVPFARINNKLIFKKTNRSTVCSDQTDIGQLKH